MKDISLHILIATAGDLEPLETATREERALDWIVPKGAEPGDDCLFSHMGRGLVAAGQIASLSRDVSHEEIVDKFPRWKSPTYPRMYTSPPPDIAKALRAFLGTPPPLDLPKEDSPSLPEGGI